MKPKTEISNYAKICVTLYPDDLAQLREKAKVEERDVSYYVRKAVRASLEGA